MLAGQIVARNDEIGFRSTDRVEKRLKRGEGPINMCAQNRPRLEQGIVNGADRFHVTTQLGKSDSQTSSRKPFRSCGDQNGRRHGLRSLSGTPRPGAI